MILGTCYIWGGGHNLLFKAFKKIIHIYHQWIPLVIWTTMKHVEAFNRVDVVINSMLRNSFYPVCWHKSVWIGIHAPLVNQTEVVYVIMLTHVNMCTCYNIDILTCSDSFHNSWWNKCEQVWKLVIRIILNLTL